MDLEARTNGPPRALSRTATAQQPDPDIPGMPSSGMEALRRALEEPTGLVVIAGPPRSGRSATIEALLASRSDAIMASDLGSRQTALSAIDAARWGLVVGMIDAGDSIAAIRRIIALGVDPFPVACSLRLVVAQRLVRCLCSSCRKRAQPPNSVTAPLGLEPGTAAYEARGCDICDGTGFAGRIGVFETLPVDATVGRLIVCGAEQAAIANHVFRDRPNLAGAIRALVVHGLTTTEEARELLRTQRQ